MPESAVEVAHPILDVEVLESPAHGADEQKPEPAAAVEETTAEGEAVKVETDEQKAERRESRRSRARAREAAKLAEAQTEARMLRERLDSQTAKPVTEEEPKREAFDSLEDYHRALAKHEARLEARQTIETERKARQEQETKARTSETDRKIADAWSKGEEAFKKEAKDYDEVVAEFVESDLSDLDLSARRAILESDLGQRVLYHLAKNPDEAERIAKLSPTRQVIEIGKLEDKVVPQKKQTSAPAPVSQVKGRSTVVGYSDNMSDADFRAWSKANGARWAQR